VQQDCHGDEESVEGQHDVFHFFPAAGYGANSKAEVSCIQSSKYKYPPADLIHPRKISRERSEKNFKRLRFISTHSSYILESGEE
jgi:hypothetical protein